MPLSQLMWGNVFLISSDRLAKPLLFYGLPIAFRLDANPVILSFLRFENHSFKFYSSLKPNARGTEKILNLVDTFLYMCRLHIAKPPKI